MNRRKISFGLTASMCAAVLAIAAFATAGPKMAPKDADKGGDTSALEGKPAPDFTFTTLDGKTVKLSEQKGTVVLMDYWATWCPPCRKGLPHINEFATDKDLATKGLKVWAINSKEPEDKVKPFVQKNNFTFTVPMDLKGDFGRDYLVQGIPTTVVVGRDGIIKKVFIGYTDGEEKEVRKAVEEALKEGGKTT